MKRETWKYIIQHIVAILTAIATTLGVTLEMSWKQVGRLPIRKSPRLCGLIVPNGGVHLCVPLIRIAIVNVVELMLFLGMAHFLLFHHSISSFC
ncbi:MAG: smalltalk protein [Prevotella sp.]|nr:smalltalk protein [Prevotella sp.]